MFIYSTYAACYTGIREILRKQNEAIFCDKSIKMYLFEVESERGRASSFNASKLLV